MAVGRWNNWAVQNYGSQSEYGKSLSYEQKADAYKKLMGADFDPFEGSKSGFGNKLSSGNSIEKQYANLFEHVKSGGWKGGTATGEKKLKADSFTRWKGMSDNAALEKSLRDQMMTKAYDRAINDLYETGDVDDETKAKQGMNDYGMKWVYKKNRLTGETEITQDKDIQHESNFWRRHKDSLITGAGGVAGGIIGSIVPVIGTAYGAMLGASLARSTREAYKARADARKIKDLQRDWENDPSNQPWQPTGGNLYQSAGEGVVEYGTKDIEKKGKRAYVRGGARS